METVNDEETEKSYGNMSGYSVLSRTRYRRTIAVITGPVTRFE
jgi:hypothetical protein